MAHINFEEESHVYYRDDGVIVPSVTQVLEDVGIIDTQYFTEQGRIRGTYVHQATQYYDEGRLDSENLDPALKPYLAAYERFLLETDFQPEFIETPLFNEPYQYAGTLDRIGNWPGNGVGLLDIKSGYVPKWVALQLAAYAKARRVKFDFIISLQLKGNGRYDILEYTETDDDFQQFLYALKTYQYKHQEKQYYAQEKP